MCDLELSRLIGISGLVVEYIVAIDVTRVRFPADAFSLSQPLIIRTVQRLATRSECILLP